MKSSSRYNDFTKKALILEMASRDVDIVDFVDFHFPTPTSSEYIFKAKIYDNCFIYFKSTITSDIACSYEHFANDFHKLSNLIEDLKDERLFYYVFIKEQIFYKATLMERQRANCYTQSVDLFIKRLSLKYDGVVDFLKNFENENLKSVSLDIFS